MKPVCGECFWVWPFHAPWCSEECRWLPRLRPWLFAVLLPACVLDVTPGPYRPPPLTVRDAGTEDSGHETSPVSQGRVQ